MKVIFFNRVDMRRVGRNMYLQVSETGGRDILKCTALISETTYAVWLPQAVLFIPECADHTCVLASAV